MDRRGLAQLDSSDFVIYWNWTHTNSTAKSINIKLWFSDPLKVSIGSVKDLLNVTILAPEIFLRKVNGRYFTFIETDQTIEGEVPQQFSSLLEK